MAEAKTVMIRLSAPLKRWTGRMDRMILKYTHELKVMIIDDEPNGDT